MVRRIVHGIMEAGHDVMVVMCALACGLALSVGLPARAMANEMYATVPVCSVSGRLIDASFSGDAEAQARCIELFDACVDIDSACSDDAAKKLLLWWSRVPTDVRERFANDGWRLRMIHGEGALEATEYAAMVEPKAILGMCVPSESLLMLEDSDEAISVGLLHEMGHYVDHSLGDMSYLDASWAEAFGTESESFVALGRFDDYALTNSTEFFAEVWRQSVLYPETMSRCCPNAFAHVADTVS